MSVHDTDRLIFLLETVGKEGSHLLQTTERLSQENIDAEWVKRLEDNIQLSERVDAFGARFGRMQDTMGDKLIPVLLECLSETAGSTLDNLNRIEKLRLLYSVTDWLEARSLRNRLIHEYVQDASEFAFALIRARELVPLLVRTFNALNTYAQQRFASDKTSWPSTL